MGKIHNAVSNKDAEGQRSKLIDQVENLLVERGSKALAKAREEVTQEEVESKEAREALNYFITEYWKDLTRPTLFSLACEAVGGDPNVTTSISVALILISGAVDIHDDIIDQSKIKGSRPTVLGKFGVDIALLVGDALLFKGFALLHEAIEKGIPRKKATVITNIIQKAFFEIGDAEALELGFRGRVDVTPEEYLEVARKKAADVESYTRIGAIFGQGSKKEIEALGEYGRLLGLMMILGDDFIDMFDFKEIVNRVKKECLPLPILYALQNPTAKPSLVSIISKKVVSKRNAKTILEITEESGALKTVKKIIKKFGARADTLTEKIPANNTQFKQLIESIMLALEE